ncbi:cytochrome P450 [Micromonospora sp. NPDC048999]|uniref:cytochrome P450 n=1 Tax=Micromonospora sp. NPDC048999 TaxID=3155391 RepID=UPI0033F41D70
MSDVGSNAAVVEELDLGDDRLYTRRDMEPVWRGLLERDAVVWTPPGHGHRGFWSVFSHEACRAVLADDGSFTSRHGMFIGFDTAHPDTGGGRMIVVSEGERHEWLRAVVGRYFARAMTGPLHAVLVEQVDALIDVLRAAPVTDAAGRVSTWVPNEIVCEVLGVPAGDREQFRQLTHFAVGAPDDPPAMSPSAAHTRIMAYLAELVMARRRHRGDDLISALLHEGGLSVEDVLLNCDNVFAAGNATTQHSVAAMLHALAVTPGLAERLHGDRRLLRPAVEELLRWSTPGPHVLRVATADVEVNGVRLPAGAPVACWLMVANRDPRVFAEPDRFDPARQPNRHLTFGAGVHYCLGAALARMELKVLLDRLTAAARSVALADPPVRLRSTKVNGYRQLRVTFQWRTPARMGASA